MVVVVDDADARTKVTSSCGEDVTPESMAFFLEYTSGVFCVRSRRRARTRSTFAHGRGQHRAQRTAFTVTVDYRHGTSTGISAGDRAATVRALIDPETRPNDLNRPDTFSAALPSWRVLKRAGHTEATVDLCRLAASSLRRTL